MNVLTDMYNNRLEDEITKLIRKKEKIREYEAVSFKLERSKDWRGHFVQKVIDGYQSTKMKAKATFNITYKELLPSLITPVLFNAHNSSNGNYQTFSFQPQSGASTKPSSASASTRSNENLRVNNIGGGVSGVLALGKGKG